MRGALPPRRCRTVASRRGACSRPLAHTGTTSAPIAEKQDNSDVVIILTKLELHLLQVQAILNITLYKRFEKAFKFEPASL